MKMVQFLVLLFVSCAALTSSVLAAETTVDATLPEDVKTFVVNRDLCEHWAGEEPYDDARKKEIADAVKKYCTGTDEALKNIKQKYKDNAAVQNRLKGYDPVFGM